MSETLLIHYNIDNAQQATWSLCNDAGDLTGKITTGSLDELAKFAAGRSAIVLLNSQCLHINQLQLPTKNLQKTLKAVPYAIEEFIAEDIENFHFVISKNKHSDTTSVAGIDKTILKNIIQVFQEAGIVAEKIIPDALCLAANDKQWVCLNYQDSSYLQTDTLNGMVFSPEVLPYVLTKKLHNEEQALPEKILLFSEQENTSVFDQLKIDNENIEIINIVYNTHPLVVFCGHYRQALPLNLLQYKFKPKRKSSGYWHHWRLAASLAAAWLFLHLGVTGFQYSQLKNENNITKAEIEKIYKKSFPQSRKIINPRVQMEQKIKELKNNAGGSSNGLLFLLAESFGTLDQDKENITLQSLTFRNNRMDIGLESTNLQAIENLNKNLNSSTRIKSEITSSSSEKDKVKGNLRIESRS
jgi:general secretion pathway protein L